MPFPGQPMPGTPGPPGMPPGAPPGMPPIGPPMGGTPPGGPPNFQSPVGLPPGLGQGAMQLGGFVNQNPGAAVITTGLIEAMTKLIKTMTTVGEPKSKMTRVNPFNPNMGESDQIAQHQAMPPMLPNPLGVLAQGGGRPPGL
jgi:hypothetical protein